MNTGAGIKVVSLLIAVVVGGIFFTQWKDAPPPQSNSQNAAAPAGDEDSPGEAVLAVGAGIKAVEDRQQELSLENKTLRERLDEIGGSLSELQQTLTQYAAGRQKIVPVNVDDAMSLLEETAAAAESVDLYATSGEDEEEGVADGYRWHSPIAVVAVAAARIPPASSLGAKTASTAQQPVFVIPSGTLIEAKALTGLIGRIPVNGQVSDPWPFKLVATGDAHAADHKSFDVSGMILEGIAQGDFNFRCVRGRVNKVTTVLPDHSVITVEAEGNGEGFGWISDAGSNPCLPGTLISNVAGGVTRQAVYSAIAGAANAVARGEETRTVSSDGTEISSITGDAFRVAGAEAVAGAADSLKEHYQNRSDVWDAVHVPAGQPVVVHINAELQFGHDPRRKIYDKARIIADRAADSDLD